MRGPPPAWMPPHPPDRDHDYENNYEDPEDIRERGTLPLPHPSECTPVEMRGPPPAWMPPHPPDRDHDYENNYEDPEDIRERELSSRDLLLTTAATAPPPKYNSYEMSLSQQRRSGMTREPLAPALDDWTSLAEGQTVLHKNADGAYYIPSGSGGTVQRLRVCGYKQRQVVPEALAEPTL
ncbi:hypothetical protein Y032_0017g3341 [Ancylostoma ceylanicum]|uniref:Uncharacterized protein n=1 Tax=Ancylostoma ceylanicum TaxID=53326 RepID=A0A016V6S0_9BILA|nr:hypothetical protein Y032_0017g3341 [Ancylostoma ceylanicum]